MKNRSFPWAIIALAAVAGAGFAGVANYVRNQGTEPLDIAAKQGNTIPNRDVNSPDEANNTSINGDENSQKVVSKVDALNKAFKNKNYEKVRVLDVTVDEKGNAMLDMNNEVFKGFGSEEEADFIKTIQDTLGEFKSVKTFQIRVEGEIQKSLGHFEMIDPVPVR